MVLEAFWGSQGDPKSTQLEPQRSPGAQAAPKSTHNDPERTQRRLQEHPKAAQDSPDHVDVNRRPQIVKVDKTSSLWGPGGSGGCRWEGDINSVDRG